mgnify:CR=1 FL=1|nr:MAG TPA: nucleoside triphosphate pyrophosphohydrolase [Caudoviricetes sp.]
MSYELNKKYVAEHLTERDLLEGLAEEASELTKAALKLIRANGTNNFTPVTVDDAKANLIEELGDIAMIIDILGIKVPQSSDNTKWNRWATRIKERK